MYIHIGVPAVANISHHITQSIHLHHSVVWRGVLRDQGEVPHSCNTEKGLKEDMRGGTRAAFGSSNPDES